MKKERSEKELKKKKALLDKRETEEGKYPFTI